MHVKQRNLLLFRAFCLLYVVWVVNCSQVRSEKQEGEKGEWETDLLKAKHSGYYYVLWQQCLEDKLAPDSQPAECAFHVAFPLE